MSQSQSQSQSAANTRRYVVIHEAEGVGAYGFRWEVRLSVRLDGLRFAHFTSGFAWTGNSGGHDESTGYLSPAEARALWVEEYASAHEESFEEAVAAARAR
jgi:hypothetical protein